MKLIFWFSSISADITYQKALGSLMQKSEKKLDFLLPHGCHGRKVTDGIFVHRNFIQTFVKYFDSTMNVACQIDFFWKIKSEIQWTKCCAKAVVKLLGYFSPKKECFR